jgi:hypothetical protein
MALPPADPKRHRRQQLRRALIGWLGGGVLIALFVVGAAVGGDSEREGEETIPAHAAGFLDYHMTTPQYDVLHVGESEKAVLDELGKVGLPEGETKTSFIQLFPPHEEGVVCSYWEISDMSYTVARLCFSREAGVLRQKLRRDLSDSFENESAVRA